MTRLFGDPKQLGIVVKDINKAIDHWVNDLGVGPWFVNDPIPLISSRYHGKEMEDLNVCNALSHSGEWQIELIEPRHAGSSVWTDFLEAGCVGIHHFSHYAHDFDAFCDDATSRGLEIVQDGNLQSGRYAYLAHPVMKTTYYEVGEWSVERQRIFDTIKFLASTWDGKDPVRMGAPPVLG
jgi:hypothetical protein